jgi:O-antigen ligase
MYSTATYPLSHNLAAAGPQSGSLLTYLRTGSLTVWFFFLIMRYWWLSDWLAIQEEFRSGVEVRTYYMIGISVALIAHLTLGIGAWFAAPFTVIGTWSGRLFTMFCLVALLTSPLSLVPQSSALYAVATWAVFALLCLYWQNDYRIARRMVVVTGLVVLTWMYLLLLRHGWSFGSSGGVIGGINRNTTGLAALGGTVCCMMSSSKSIRWFAIVAGALIALLVTSRGTLVAFGAFFTVYYVINKGTIKAGWHAFLVFALVLMVLLASASLRDVLFEDVMRLHDKARGIGSGFTGRIEFWKQALDSFWERPIIGYGFRATTHGGGGDYGAIHSGYIKILVETGLVGGILVISAVIIELIRRFRLAIQFRNMAPQAAPGIDVVETTRVNSVACAMLALTMTIWVYDQLYINLGSVISLLFFLMMAAPAYITTQGVGLRR